jgi:hypothetical protein
MALCQKVTEKDGGGLLRRPKLHSTGGKEGWMSKSGITNSHCVNYSEINCVAG